MACDVSPVVMFFKMTHSKYPWIIHLERYRIRGQLWQSSWVGMRRRNVKPHCAKPAKPVVSCQQGGYTLFPLLTQQKDFKSEKLTIIGRTFRVYFWQNFCSILLIGDLQMVHAFQNIVAWTKYSSHMVDVSLNFLCFQISSSLKDVVNWCQSNPEYTLMENIYQPDNKNPPRVYLK